MTYVDFHQPPQSEPPPRRLVPRAALLLVLAAQVLVWGLALVFVWAIFPGIGRWFEARGLHERPPQSVLLPAVGLAYQFRWLLAGICASGLVIEALFIARYRSLRVRRNRWRLFLLLSTLLPLLLTLAAGLTLAQSMLQVIGGR